MISHSDLRGRQHCDEAVHLLSDSRRAGEGGRTVTFDIIQSSLVDVIADEWVAIANQILGHVVTHVSQADEANRLEQPHRLNYEYRTQSGEIVCPCGFSWMNNDFYFSFMTLLLWKQISYAGVLQIEMLESEEARATL